MVGSLTSLMGFPFAGVIISSAGLSTSAWSLRAEGAKSEEKLHELDLKYVSAQGITRIDLNKEEVAFLQPRRRNMNVEAH